MKEIIPEDWHRIVQEIERISRDKNLTTYDLAERSGIRQPNISRIFALKFSPTLKVLQRLADAAGAEITITDINVGKNVRK